MPPNATVPPILRPIPVVIAMLMVGPFALPLVWVSPAFSRAQKAAITLIVALFSVWLVHSSVRLYGLLMERMQQLQQALSP